VRRDGCNFYTKAGSEIHCTWRCGQPPAEYSRHDGNSLVTAGGGHALSKTASRELIHCVLRQMHEILVSGHPLVWKDCRAASSCCSTVSFDQGMNRNCPYCAAWQASEVLSKRHQDEELKGQEEAVHGGGSHFDGRLFCWNVFVLMLLATRELVRRIRSLSKLMRRRMRKELENDEDDEEVLKGRWQGEIPRFLMRVGTQRPELRSGEMTLLPNS
jgi:hypothetical protein